MAPPAGGEAPRALEWEAALGRALAATGCVALVGAPDAGKSTFALALANRAVEAGRAVAVVSSDVGQAELGPPAVVSLGRLEHPVGALSELRPRALAFVGDTSPVGNLLPVVLGTLSLARRAAERGAELVIVDTSGLVAGRLGERLKLSKLEAMQPALTLVFQRGEELERLRALLAGVCEGEVLAARTPPQARRKTPAYRKGRRERQWAAYFHAARPLEIPVSQVEVVNAWPFTGRPLPAHHVKFASEALRTPVLHGEVTPDGLWLCVQGRPERAGFALIQEQLRERRINVTPAAMFTDLLVGLIGHGGVTLGIGLLQGIHFGRGAFPVLTPVASAAAVRQLWFGRVRVGPEGVEWGRLRPGDI